MLTRRRSLPTLLTAVLAGFLLLVGLPLGAWAHTDLLSSDPKDGASLTAMPPSVSLEFNEDVDPNFAQAVVADSENVARPVTATVSGPRMTVPIPEEVPDGKVEVRYRIVSKDGHPVAGMITFSVGATAPSASAPAVQPPTAAMARPSAASNAQAAPVDAQEASTVGLYALTGVAAALVVGVGLMVFLMSRRHSR